MPSLHRAQEPDWNKVTSKDRNGWQRLAAQTHGVVTAGNIISVVSAAVVVYGLYLLSQDLLLSGLVIILIGRLGDIADGWVADLTGTKSPLGEFLDAFIDKLLLAPAVIVLLAYHLIPLPVWIFIFIHGTYNTCMSAISIYRNVKLHPIRSGKLGTAFEWLSIGFYILEQYARGLGHQLIANTFFAVATICAVLLVIGSGYSSYVYTRQLIGKPRNAK